MSKIESILEVSNKEVLSARPSRLVLANIMPPNFTTRFSALGVETLAGYVRNKLGGSCNVKIIDSQLCPSREKMVEEILSFAPHVVGFSLHPGARSEVDKTIELIQKRERPLLIFGNVVATFTAGNLIENYPQSLVVLGEGEEALVGVINSLRLETNLEEIPNIAFRGNLGEIIFTRRERMDLKKLGLPAFDNTKRYVEGDFRIGAEASRGCYYNCSFCNRGKFLSERFWRGYLPERTLKLLVELSSRSVPGINFADDDFLQGPKDHLVQLAQGIIDLKKEGKINPKFQFFFSVRVNEVISRTDILKKLSEAGLAGVFLGIESGDEEVLARFGKRFTLSQVEAAVKILNGLNLTLEAGFIMFDPQMTLAQLENNINFIKKTGIAPYLSYPFSQLRAQPGSPLLDRLNKANLLTGGLDLNWLVYPYQFQDERIPLVIRGCKEWEMGFYRVTDCLKDLYRYHGLTKDVNSQTTQRINHYLGEMRKLYIEFLSSMINWVKESKERSSLEELENRFSGLRASLMASTLKDVEAGALKDTFNVLYKEGVLALIRDYSLSRNSPLVEPVAIASAFGLQSKNVSFVLGELYDRGEISRRGKFYLLPSLTTDVFRRQDFLGIDS